MKKLTLILVLTLLAATSAHAATLAERYVSLLTALNDAPPSAQLQTRVADAVVELERDWLEANGYDPDGLTDNQKRALVLRVTKRALKAVVLRHDPNVAAAQSDLQTAVTAAQSQANTDLPDEGNP